MGGRTWDEAEAQWLVEKGHKASIAKDREIFAWLAEHLRGRPLQAIDRKTLLVIARLKAAQTSYATANRHLALIRAVLRRARDVWEWVQRCPKIPMFPAGPHRVRWLSRAEAAELIRQLPRHQAAMARFGLATGLRQRNVCRLKWTEVDQLASCIRLAAARTKNHKPLVIPLNSAAKAVLSEQSGLHPEYVFTFHGRPVWQVSTGTWRAALKRAGIADFRWHDLRHTWASWHAQAGTPFNVLQDLGGWSSYEMVRRYAHLSAAHLAPHAERIPAV